MIRFHDALEFKTFLANQGHEVDNLDSEFACESFCKNNADFYYQEDEQPRFIYDQEKDLSYEIFVNKLKFENGQKTEDRTESFIIKTSIPLENDTIIAFEDMAWRAAHKKYKKWFKEPGMSPSLKYKRIK